MSDTNMNDLNLTQPSELVGQSKAVKWLRCLIILLFLTVLVFWIIKLPIVTDFWQKIALSKTKTPQVQIITLGCATEENNYLLLNEAGKVVVSVKPGDCWTPVIVPPMEAKRVTWIVKNDIYAQRAYENGGFSKPYVDSPIKMIVNSGSPIATGRRYRNAGEKTISVVILIEY